jgi:hypothetical protein
MAAPSALIVVNPDVVNLNGNIMIMKVKKDKLVTLETSKLRQLFYGAFDPEEVQDLFARVGPDKATSEIGQCIVKQLFPELTKSAIDTIREMNPGQDLPTGAEMASALAGIA